MERLDVDVQNLNPGNDHIKHPLCGKPCAMDREIFQENAPLVYDGGKRDSATVAGAPCHTEASATCNAVNESTDMAAAAEAGNDQGHHLSYRVGTATSAGGLV